MNYECHITVRRADAEKAQIVASEHHWKFSQIDGDPVLGKEVFAYLTTHDSDVRRMFKRMELAVVNLKNSGVEVIREKIELIVYDTKKLVIAQPTKATAETISPPSVKNQCS
jgi:hypothetical protein